MTKFWLPGLGLAALLCAATANTPSAVADIVAGKALQIEGKTLDIVGLATEVKGIDLGIAGSRVTVTPQEVRIELPSDILFDFDKAEIRPNAIVGRDGVEREVDTIILGTGFHVTDLPIAERVRGRDGKTLAEHWDGTLEALRGGTVKVTHQLRSLSHP